MVDKIGQFSVFIHLFTSSTVGPGDSPGTTTEHPHLAHIAVFLLDKSEEGGHVWPSKMVASFQSSKQTSFGQSLEMVLAYVQHGGPEIELVEEDVNLEHVCDVLPLNLPEDVDEPLETTVWG